MSRQSILFTIQIDNGLRPRLQIIFEYYQEAEKFRNRYEYDEVKQLEITKQFEKTLIAQRLLKKKKLWNLFTKNKPDKYKTKNILVIFSAFETIAKIETSWNIPESEIQKLQSELDTPDLWKIYPEIFNNPTFFFYTDKQADQYSKNEMIEYLTEKYFNLLKSFDEFDYIKKEQFSIKLDSKENFDNIYNGSWFNYDKR